MPASPQSKIPASQQKRKTDRRIVAGIIAGIILFLLLSVFISMSQNRNTPEPASASVQVLWHFREHGRYFGYLANNSDSVLEGVHITVETDIERDSAGFSLGSEHVALPVEWMEDAGRISPQSVDLSDAAVTNINPHATASFNLNAPKMAFPPKVRITDKYGHSIPFTQGEFHY
jgi:hypothetical protein